MHTHLHTINVYVEPKGKITHIDLNTPIGIEIHICMHTDTYFSS